MALSSASIPVIVSSAILELLHQNLVYAKLFNEDYQGDVAAGNTVKIPSIGAVVTEAYTRYTDLTGQNAADTSVDLLIDQQRAFSITIDDIDKAQAKPAILAAYAKEATFQLQKDVDAYLASVLVAGTLVTGLGTSTTPIEVNSANIAAQLRAMALLLDNALVPRAGRAIVLPPWAIDKLVLASIVNAVDITAPAAEQLVGRYAGFNILMSPLVPNTASAKYRIVGGAPISATYAVQVEKTEQLRHPKQFADVLRGLLVYGAKLSRPATIASAYWNLAAEA
jgi:hypothetical protein